jgi:sugar O-acyltransferase (sialic acid O-acetyltransferase NeuD family)
LNWRCRPLAGRLTQETSDDSGSDALKYSSVSRLLIWGVGGPATQVISQLQAANGYDEVGLIDDRPGAQTELLGFPVLGTRRVLEAADPGRTHVFAAGNTPGVRRMMAEYLRDRGFARPSFVDPAAIVRPGARLGPGCLIQAFAFVDQRAILGEHVLLSVSASVAHDCTIGDYCSLYAGSRALGFVKLETGVLLGANSCVHPYRCLGAWSQAGMLSAVYADVPALATVSGNPARIVSQASEPPGVALLPLLEPGTL